MLHDRILTACLILIMSAFMPAKSRAEAADIQPSGTLPVMYINVYGEDGEYNNEVISKDLDHKEYFQGEYWLDISGCEWAEAEGLESVGTPQEPLPLQIKARGNWTMKAYSKKPYKLKLDKKKPLLGLSKSKHFALLAHADDNLGYLRNFVGFNLGHRIGLDWTPNQQPLELVVNGDYRGIYFLTETPRVEADRVDIAELADLEEEPELISGGYLVEIDNYWEPTGQIRMYEAGLPEDQKHLIKITMQSPEDLSDVQHRFIEEQFWTMNQLIGEGSDLIWSYIDLDDLVRYYLVREIMQDTECFAGSTFISRDRGEGQKWRFTALWDFGNAFVGEYNNYTFYDTNYHNVWIPQLFKIDGFQEKLRQTWLWVKSSCLEGLNDDIDVYISRLGIAAQADYERWADAPLPVNVKDEKVADNREVNFLSRIVKLQLKRRLEWLDSEWGEATDEAYPEPRRDDTPAAELPGYAKSGVEEILDKSSQVMPIYYYDMWGRKISIPTIPGIYLRSDGAKEVISNK